MNSDSEWDAERAKEPLLLIVEVQGRTAALIRLFAEVTGLSPENVVIGRLEAGNYAAKNISNFISLLLTEIIGPNPTDRAIDHAASKLRSMRAAGHIHGFDDIDLDMAISEQTGQIDEDTASLLKAAAQILEETQE